MTDVFLPTYFEGVFQEALCGTKSYIQVVLINIIRYIIYIYLSKIVINCDFHAKYSALDGCQTYKGEMV